MGMCDARMIPDPYQKVGSRYTACLTTSRHAVIEGVAREAVTVVMNP